MTTNKRSYVGRMFRYKCKCGGVGEVDNPGCGLVSDGAVLRGLDDPQEVDPRQSAAFPRLKLVLGWFIGHDGAPLEQFCSMDEDNVGEYAFWIGASYPDGGDVYVHPESLIPLEDDDGNA